MFFRLLKKVTHRIRDWEQWPFYLFYFPISFAWVIYFVRSRSIWFYTGSNPTLAFGGFEGERKSNMYRQLPPQLCPHSLYIRPQMPLPEVEALLQNSGLLYPFIVKPDIGMKGILFRKIENRDQLSLYHQKMVADYIIQEFIDLPLEVSVFYCRRPGDKKGTITALIQKDLLEVTGNGSSTLTQLVSGHPYAHTLLKKIRSSFGQRADEIVPEGQVICLSQVANLVNGARFQNLKHLVNDSMLDVFDTISRQSQFFYGRYDIKCTDVADLGKGEGFKILEFNGAGSVPNHIYTGTYTLLGAYREILHHWQWLFQISEDNRRKGFEYWSLGKGHRFLQNSKRYFDRLKKLDDELVISRERT